MGDKERPGHFRGGDGAHHKPVIKSLSRHWEERLSERGRLMVLERADRRALSPALFEL